MRIRQSMIHPELRTAGALIRVCLPYFTERKFRAANGMTRFLTGKCHSRLLYRQQYVSRADGSSLRLCIYSPLQQHTDVPGLLWIHGGGYALGVPEQDESAIRRFIEASGCVVVAPDYRLSVQAPYPAALEDCYMALLWLKEHGCEYGMRNDQIMVGGVSAGGGLTAAVSLYARDQGTVAIACQMPLYPMLDDRMNTPSATDNDAPVWNTRSNLIGWQLYLGELYGQPEIPVYAAPARSKDCHGLPPAISFIGSIDPFLDETVLYMEQLRASGIPVHFQVYDGCFHSFDTVCAHTRIAREAIGFMLDRYRYAVKHYFAEQPTGIDLPTARFSAQRST